MNSINPNSNILLTTSTSNVQTIISASTAIVACSTGITAGIRYFANKEIILYPNFTKEIPFRTLVSTVTAATGAVTAVTSLFAYTITEKPNQLPYIIATGVACAFGGTCAAIMCCVSDFKNILALGTSR